MEKTLPNRPDWPTLAVAAACLAAGWPAAANAATGTPAAAVAVYGDSADRPQLVQGYRAALGLKTSPSGSRVLGRGSATTQVLVRLAQTHAVPEPLFYAVERVPRALGLRGAEQAAGIVLRGRERWTSSFELSSAASAFTANRHTALLGQIHAPFAGGIGVSVGIRYSSVQMPAHTGAGADTPFGYGYMLPPERADSGAQQLGYQLQLNYLYGERNTVALTYNSRRELDQYRLASDPLSSDAWQLSLTGEHWFSPSWALRYDIPTPESSGVVWRQGLRLGVHYRF